MDGGKGKNPGAQRYFESARAKSRGKKFQGALADYAQAIKLDPDNVEIYRHRAWLNIRLGLIREAIDDFSKILDRQPEATAYINRGILRKRLGEFESAQADFDKARKLDPECEDFSQDEKEDITEEKTDPQKKVAEIAEGLRRDPENVNLYRDRALYCVMLGRLQEAVGDYGRVIQLLPADTAAYSSRGALRWELGDLEGALGDYIKVLQFDPDNITALRSCGMLCHELEKFQEALTYLNEAIRRDPEDIEAYECRGMTHEKLGDLKKADADFDQADALDPRLEDSSDAFN